MEGIVKRIVADKGFGFIVAGRDEYFFHRSAVQGTKSFESLREGSKVEFEVTSGPKGLRAENVEGL